MICRTTSGVIGVDRASGNVAFHIGHDVLAQQHTPVEIESGSILIFNNGNMRPGNASTHSQIFEVDP